MIALQIAEIKQSQFREVEKETFTYDRDLVDKEKQYMLGDIQVQGEKLR